VRPDIDNRIKEGAIAARFNTCLHEIRPTTVVVTGVRGRESVLVGTDAQGDRASVATATPAGRESTLYASGHDRGAAGERAAANGKEELPADAVFLLVGYRADTQLMVDAGVELTAREGPCYNPDTFETNVPGLFVAGGALAGVETGTVFIENGRFHGEKIVETIARRVT
jgi:hypothetical protein